MTFKRRYVDYAIAGLLLLLPAILLRSSLKSPESLGGFDKAVLRVSAPLQAAAFWVVSGIGGYWGDYLWLVDVEDENDRLRISNLRLREELGHASRDAARLYELEDLLELKGRTQAETAAAHVISSSINSHFRVNRIRIDRSGEQVEVGMPVISAEGLVVGHIVSIDSAEHGLYQKVRVKPAVDFSSLRSVLILMAPPPAPDPGKDEKRKSSLAHRMEPF